MNFHLSYISKLLVYILESGIKHHKPNICTRGHHGRDSMVVAFTTTYAISAYHHKR